MEMFKQENVISGVHVRIADSLRRTVWRESGGAGVRKTALLTRQVGPPFPGRDAGHPAAPRAWRKAARCARFAAAAHIYHVCHSQTRKTSVLSDRHGLN